MNVFDVPRPSVAIAGSDESFPVHRIYCVGQNYRAHAREMGTDPDREPPVWFTKVPDCVVPSGSEVPYPPRTNDLHHEIELVVALAQGGRNLSADAALRCVFGYTVGIDLTRRDLQTTYKRGGKPWDPAKSFEQAAPVAPIVPVLQSGHPQRGRIWLAVNDEMRQDGDIADLIWPVGEALAELSTLFTLAPGDLLFTGTPAGVGPLVPGDRIRGGIDGIADIDISIGPPLD